MSLLRWTPARDIWAEARRMSREMDHLNRLFAGDSGWTRRAPGLFPALNIFSTEDGLVVRAEMPGVPLESIDLNLTRDTLTIKGERKVEAQGDNVSYHRRERRGGVFNRTLQLPYEVDPELANAGYKDGVLEIKVARAEDTRPRKISIQAG